MVTIDNRSTLPKHSYPLKYRLSIEPDFENLIFKGKVAIDIVVTNPTANLSLNAVDLEITSASLIMDTGPSDSALEVIYDQKSETVTLDFGHTVPAGLATLELEFIGQLNDRLHGFYRSTYKTDHNDSQVLAATQFEPTDARRAFPCWDEPNKKAHFEVTLAIPLHMTAVSNTPIIEQYTDSKHQKQVRFAETPKMSTYLLAFVIGELESIEDMADDGTLLRVWTTPGKSEQGRFALEVSKRLLAYYNDYFGVSYPLKKLDQLAIPDFAAGAMENWGAITYREVALLFDPNSSSLRTRQVIAEIVAHEMAHMWFGDLVTMDWWDDLWLNESFASWMATKAVDHLYPEWDLWTQFVSSDVNAGLSLDGLEKSHPIKQDVTVPSEINQLFDAISYQKGASILRMLEQFIGPDQFKRGLRRYISQHSYGNATGRDLWIAMQEETGHPIVAMMESWIDQVGYPVLQVNIKRNKTISIEFTQRRFLYSGHGGDTTLWQVPVTVAIQGNDELATTMLTTRNASLEIKSAEGAERHWIKINSQQTGFYRVQYTEDELARLIPALEDKELPTADRLGLQSDTYALARAGLIPAIQFLELAQAYRNESEYAVWDDLTGNLYSLAILMCHEPYYEEYQRFARSVLNKIAQNVAWEKEPGESHLRTLLRSTVLNQIGSFGDMETLQEAQRRFERYLIDQSSLSPELRSVVYALAAQAGDNLTYTTISQLHRDANSQEEKLRLLRALASFRQPSLLHKTIEMSLSDRVRSQDSVSLVNLVAANPEGGADIAWQYIKQNWTEFHRRYGSGGFALMRLVQITGRFTTPDYHKDVDSFFKKNPIPSASRTIQQSLERITLNIRWLDQNRRSLAQWLVRT